MPGLRLCRHFYEQAVVPLITPVLGTTPYAAAVLGPGSEVLGFDDAISTDHGFGPRVQLFLPERTDPAPVLAALDGLPERFEDYPVAYPAVDGGPVHHQVQVTTAAGFFRGFLGIDPQDDGMSVADWLCAPTQVLATLTAGAVFHDPAGLLEARRVALRWYPPDVWRYVLAAAWIRISQEQAFVGRTGAAGDELGCALVTARLAREYVRLAFLVERRWAPYSKWLGRGFAQLPIAALVGPPLRAALRAGFWRDAETTLVTVGSLLGIATNQLGLAEPVDPVPHQFHGRDIRVVPAEGFAAALLRAVTDPRLRELADRLGTRPDGTAAIPGAIDQVVDSVDVLTDPDRCRAAGAVLGVT